MAKGRMIKTRISRSKKLASLCDDSARLLYFMIYPHTDIEGRIEADPPLIKSFTMPYFSDWDSSKIQCCLNKLHDVGLIILYQHKDDQYLQITKFADHQSLRKDREADSDIPPAPASQEEKPKPAKMSPSDEQKWSDEFIERAKALKKLGWNIYQLYFKFRKQSKLIHDLPEDVLIATMDEIAKAENRPIKDRWPYFIRILEQKSAMHFSAKNEEEGKAHKKEGAVPLSSLIPDNLRGK